MATSVAPLGGVARFAMLSVPMSSTTVLSVAMDSFTVPCFGMLLCRVPPIVVLGVVIFSVVVSFPAVVISFVCGVGVAVGRLVRVPVVGCFPVSTVLMWGWRFAVLCVVRMRALCTGAV